ILQETLFILKLSSHGKPEETLDGDEFSCKPRSDRFCAVFKNDPHVFGQFIQCCVANSLRVENISNELRYLFLKNDYFEIGNTIYLSNRDNSTQLCYLTRGFHNKISELIAIVTRKYKNQLRNTFYLEVLA
ncbi:unnamed protein product, partial [Haemonchus placei]|uniref:Ras-associating domain-containing protein n=1 Tax=Haemonchus placei TaxID=6290 RepID=A0A0N4VU44_HAEPC